MDAKLTFTGTRKTLAFMHWKAFWLMLITFGLYRFWFKTNLRRYYWSNTTFNDERIEYTGTGSELFKGFLIALCLIVPLQIAVVLGSVTIFSLYIFAIVALIYLFLGHFATFASRRYRLTRTLWRGLRFRLEGSGLKYALHAAGWSFVSFITLGLASPWGSAYLERYKMQRTFFGDVQGNFDGKPFDLFKKLIIIMLFTSIPLISAVVYGVSQISFEQWRDIFAALASQDEQSIDEVFENLNDNAKHLGTIFLGLLPLWFFVTFITLPAYVAIKFRWIMNGVSIGNARFTSTFTALQSYKIWGKAILLSMAISTAVTIVGTVIFAIVITAFSATFKQMAQNTTLIYIGIIAGVFLYLMVFFASWLLKALLINYSYWRDQTNSLTFHNFETLENAAMRAQETTAIGEGLDTGGGFGELAGI